MKIKYLLVVISFLSSHFMYAQNKATPFSEEETKRIEQQAKDYIKSFTRAVPKLATTQDEELQRTITANIKSLFIPIAKVAVMNLDQRKHTYSLTDYLLHVVANYADRFGLVVVKFENIVVNHNSFSPITNSDGVITGYKGTYSFVQIFCVTDKDFKKEGKYEMEDFSVCEKTKKKGEIILKKVTSPTTGDRWVLLLGNIQANQIENLKK